MFGSLERYLPLEAFGAMSAADKIDTCSCHTFYKQVVFVRLQ